MSDGTGGPIHRVVQGTLKMNDKKYNECTSYIKNFFAELVGTGILVFIGCMGVFNKADHTGTTIAFGLAAFMGIEVACHVSGGHINPTVTVAAILFKKVTIPMAIVYILGQCAGSLVFFSLLRAVTPDLTGKLCATVPDPNMQVWQSLLVEFILSGILILLVCSIWDPRNAHHDSATLKFGFGIAALAFSGVSYSGCSMNPARSLGPAILEGTWTQHWIYWVGPLLGSLVATIAYRTFFFPEPTSRPAKVEMETVQSS